MRRHYDVTGRRHKCSVTPWRHFITVLSDDDDDGILSVSDEISSFGFYSDDDNDVKRHQKINNADMTI